MILPPAKRKNTFCQRQKLCPPRISSTAKPTLMSRPMISNHHCVVMPRMGNDDSKLLLRAIQPLCPVAAPIVESATGTAKVSANQALKPIQKKISHIPWLQPSSQPKKG